MDMKYENSLVECSGSIMEMPSELRPRERMMKLGAMALSDLEALDGRTNPSMDVIRSINGLGDAKVSVVCAALELGRRMNFSRKKQIRTPSDVFPLIRHYGDREQEHFLTVLLNGAHEVISIKVITVGLLNKTLVHPREVFSDAIRDRACALILAHNHPSGNLEPSSDDRMVTSEMVSAGRILGIRILDHLIFSSDSFSSMLEQGFMTDLNQA